MFAFGFAFNQTLKIIDSAKPYASYSVPLIIVGLSLLTLAMVIVLSNVAEAIFIIARYVGDVTPFIVYVLVGIVFLLGVTLIFVDKQK